MPYEKYVIRPTRRGLTLSTPPLHQQIGTAQWGTKNVKVEGGAIVKRRGYHAARDLTFSGQIYNIIYGLFNAGTAETVVLTSKDAIKIHADTNSWEFINSQHTGGTANVDEAVGGTPDATILGTTTDWVDTGDATAPAAGDLFILDADYDDDGEPNDDWREISSITDDTHLELTETYGQSEVAAAAYTIVNRYSVPTNEGWNYAFVKDKLYITNGDINVQVYDGTGTFAELDSTTATKARYCIPFADRLILADLFVSGTRQIYSIYWSKSGDPSDWTATGSGSADLGDTSDYITGLGVIGNYMVIYKQDSLVLGTRTGLATKALLLSSPQKGVGMPAPYSLVHAYSTNFFAGRSDFFVMNGDRPIPIGKEIRTRFFDMVSPTELKKVFGYHHELDHEIRWHATDQDGKRWQFCFDYIYEEWTVNDHSNVMWTGGKGANI